MINKTITIAIAIIVSITALGAEKERKVKSKINNVTVFLQGAQIQRKGRFNLEKGITKLVFEGITQNFNKNSIQAKGRGNFIILDVSHNVFYPIPETIEAPSTIPLKTQRAIRLITDSINKSNWRLKQYRSSLDIYNSEKSILLSSGVVKGQTQNDSIPFLKDALIYLRNKSIEINKLIIQNEKKIEIESALNTKMNNRLRILNNWKSNVTKSTQNKKTSPIQQIIVTVSSDVATSGSLEISYNSPSAGWSPSYDLRADQINTPINLTYKAKIYQNTGINWNNVNVTLSTINPNRNNNKPVLAPWYINYYSPIQRGATNYAPNRVSTESLNKVNSVDDFKDMDEEAEAEHISNFTEMNNNMTMVEFDLKIPYSIPSDGKEHLMAVSSNKIDAEFEYFAIPKKEREAFLIAKLTNWEDLNLLPAIANIYYDGTYVGQTRISPSTMTDTLELALGRDRRIVVEQKKISNEEKIKKLSNEKESTLTYQITIKSLKSAHIKLTLMDQIPLANVDEIKVNLINKGKAGYNEYKGYLTWNMTINPRETKKIIYSYSITYNKDKTLVL